MSNAFKHDFSDGVGSAKRSAANRRRNNRRRGQTNSNQPNLLQRLTTQLRKIHIPTFRFSLPPISKAIPRGFAAPKFSLPKLPLTRIASPRWFPLIGAALGFATIMLFVGSGGRDVDASVSLPQEEWVQPELLPQASEIISQQSTQLKAGDNAISALMRLGFDRSTSHILINQANSAYKLRNIRAGQRFTRIDSGKQIDIYYNIDGEKRLHLKKSADDGNWSAAVDQRSVHHRRRFAFGTIEDSLFVSAEKAGMDQRTTMNLVDIFAWDIDFARDLRNGDSFQVAYEERYDDEGKMLESRILSAEFINQGHAFRAVRYEQRDGRVGYFTPDGKSMRKAYLKAPVKFSRISSTFKLKRKHPVLGYTRAHRGVDYAAPSGTPIHAIGDGHITFVGWKNGYGRFIQIRHNNKNHTTGYAHMRSYAKGLKRGKKVRQGQIIGYVGMSGLATGPHLHFEFRSRGRAVNPLTVKHPPAKPVAGTEKVRFKQQTAPHLGLLKDKPQQLIWG